MWIYFTFTALIYSAVAQDRTVSSTLNLGCDNCNSTSTTLVYLRADGKHDTVHQIWDFTRGIPTAIFAITSPNSTVNITWVSQTPMSFEFTQLRYSFAAAVDKIYEFNDVEDNAELDKRTARHYSTKHLNWNRTVCRLSENEVLVELESHKYFTENGWRLGTISFKLDMLPFKEYATDLPHLIHTVNSTLIDISFSNMTLSPVFNSSRFAVGILIVSTDPREDHMHITMRKSLDDEHTPGVFEITEIRTPESFNNDDGGFVQYRPVAYTEKERGVTTSTNIYTSSFEIATLPKKSTIGIYYNSFDEDKLLIQEFDVSFGGPGDGFYKKTNYTAWSFTIGYGVPPVEGFSLFIILVICIGLGVPVFLLLTGVSYVLTRRWKQRNAPERLRD